MGVAELWEQFLYLWAEQIILGNFLELVDVLISPLTSPELTLSAILVQ